MANKTVVENPPLTKQSIFISKPSSWRIIYICTLLIEAFTSGCFRGLVGAIFGYLVVANAIFTIFGAFNSSIPVLFIVYSCVLLFGLLPLGISIYYLFKSRGSGNVLRRWELGAYAPTEEQVERVQRVFTKIKDVPFIKQGGGSLQTPKYMLVIPDHTFADAEMVGDTLYVTEHLFTTQFFPVLVAHQLAYLNSRNSRLRLALKCLKVPLVGRIGSTAGTAARGLSVLRGSRDAQDIACLLGCFGLLFRFCSGGIGELVLRLLWNSHWREATLMADEFVYCCGGARQLITYLDFYRSIEVPQPYFKVDKPYITERIKRLHMLLEAKSLAIQYVPITKDTPLP
ncbi:MAG TPA: hypothetical protein VGD31_16150 [Sphingobacteriaceae bacterium]